MDVVYFLLGVAAIVTIIVFASKRKKKRKSEAQTADAVVKAKDTIKLKHMTGLPIAEGMKCKIHIFPNKYVFEYKGQTFNLDCDRIDDVAIRTEKEVRNAYVSSAGGAVGGAIMFGALGALVGGRTKKKRDTTYQSYLIFAYKKDGGAEFITFDCTNTLKGRKCVKAFKKLPQRATTVVDL